MFARSYPYAHRGSGDRNPYTNSNSYTHSNRDANAYTHVDAHCDSYTYADTHAAMQGILIRKGSVGHREPYVRRVPIQHTDFYTSPNGNSHAANCNADPRPSPASRGVLRCAVCRA